MPTVCSLSVAVTLKCKFSRLVTFAQNETFRTMRDLLDLQPKTATAGQNRDAVIEKLAKDVLTSVPQPIPLGAVMEKYPVMYEQVRSSDVFD
jgi:hypothetical protein